MKYFKYLLFVVTALFSIQSYAVCYHPATYPGIAHKPFPATVCYPDGDGKYCEFRVIDNGMDIQVPCTNPSGCSAPAYAIDIQSISSTVYKNPDCTNPPLQDGCVQLRNGNIECKEEEEEENDQVLQCSSDSCPNPNGLRCPSGYVSGSFNGQKICAKSKDQEPDPECDPETQNCDDLRTERIVEAVDNANADITDSVNNLGDRMDGPLAAIIDGLQDISDKLIAIADKIRSGGGSTPNPVDPSGPVDTSAFNADVPIQDTDSKQLDSSLFSSSAQCPANNVLSLPNYNINYQFNYAQICDFLSWFSYLVMIFAYIVAAYIVIKA